MITLSEFLAAHSISIFEVGYNISVREGKNPTPAIKTKVRQEFNNYIDSLNPFDLDETHFLVKYSSQHQLSRALTNEFDSINSENGNSFRLERVSITDFDPNNPANIIPDKTKYKRWLNN